MNGCGPEGVDGDYERGVVVTEEDVVVKQR